MPFIVLEILIRQDTGSTYMLLCKMPFLAVIRDEAATVSEQPHPWRQSIINKRCRYRQVDTDYIP